MKQESVLNFLRDNQKHFVSGEELSIKLKVTRQAVWKEIEALRDLGYEIEAQPHMGYRLLSVPDKLFADEIQHGLHTKIIGRKVISYNMVDSTNDVAWKLGEEGVREGAVVFAESQKKGRGRLGRSWVSPKGKGILFSVLLRPEFGPAEVSKVTLAAAVAVAKALREATGQEFKIKWPNDILYHERKLCGILTEMSAEMDRVKFVVLGLGLNVNTDHKDLPTRSISVKEALGKEVSRLVLAKTILEKLDKEYQKLKKEEFESIAKDWEYFSGTSGKRVSVSLLHRAVEGRALGIDRDGALLVRKDNGTQERILAGDVKHLRDSPGTVPGRRP